MNRSTENYKSRYVSYGGCLTVLISPAVYASHSDGGDDNDNPIETANCNASFKSCSQAAPWPAIGSGPVEIGLLVVIIGAFLFGKHIRKKLNAQ